MKVKKEEEQDGGVKTKKKEGQTKKGEKKHTAYTSRFRAYWGVATAL